MAQHANNDEDAWTWAAMEPEPTERERALLDLFCSEYLVDGDSTKAASRCGFQAAFAKEYGTRFFQKSYVQRRLKQLEHARKDPKVEEEYMRSVCVNVLHKVATNEYERGAARVAAVRELKAVFGIDKQPDLGQGGVRGGVLVVPAKLSISEWEAIASESQRKLMEESRVD